MTTPLRLVFDVCCSPALPRELLAFYHKDYPLLETRHILENYKASTPDSVWLTWIQNKKQGWIPVTKDSGKDGKTEKLPLLCERLKITHIVFTAGIIHGGVTVHKNALVAVFSQLFLLK